MKKTSILIIIVVLSITLAACGTSTEREKPMIMTSLFPQYDIATQIGGDAIDVEFLLPAGVDAHNFEPTPRKVLEILDADLLIYTGDQMEPWVRGMVESSNHQDVQLLDLSKYVEMIALEGTLDHETNLATQTPLSLSTASNYDNIDAFELINKQNDQRVAYVHGEHWHGILPGLAIGEAITLGASIESDETEIDLTNDYQLEASFVHQEHTNTIQIDNFGDHVVLHGLKNGLALLRFDLMYQGTSVYQTPSIQIIISDDDHDHGVYDPHIWNDPINMIQMVDAITEALIDLIPNQADTFNQRAEAYKASLEAVHQAYQNMRQNIETNVMMHGGHNAFGYLINRYDIEYINPYRGFSPDAEPTPQALADMIDRMNTYNIEHLFSEVLIDPKVADAIASDTDATILYLYSGENLPKDRLDEGYRMIDVFYHNLEQLKIGLRYHE